MFLFVSVFVAATLLYCAFAWALPRWLWLQLKSRLLSLVISLSLSVAVLALVWLMLFFFYDLALRWLFYSDGEWTFTDENNAALVGTIEDLHRRLYWIPACITFISATLRYFVAGPNRPIGGLWDDEDPKE